MTAEIPQTAPEITTARDIANICATGYERHIRDHGPDSSRVAIRGLETLRGGAFIVERDGMQFAVLVSRQDAMGPLVSYAPRPEGY